VNKFKTEYKDVKYSLQNNLIFIACIIFSGTVAVWKENSPNSIHPRCSRSWEVHLLKMIAKAWLTMQQTY